MHKQKAIVHAPVLAVILAVGFIGSSLAGIIDAPHPDFTQRVVPFATKYKTMGLNFLKDGRMVLAVTDYIGGGEVPTTATSNTKVLLVTGYGGTDSAGIKIEEIANKWFQLIGATVANDKLYVSDRDGFYEIPQLSAPADLTQNRKLIVKWPIPGASFAWNNGFEWHQFGFTPIYSKGFFYAPYSGSIRPGGMSDVDATSAMSGAFLKWDLTGKLETFAGGLRSPNGANVDEATGDMFVCDNQGSWFPSSTFQLMKQGKFYGHRQSPPHPANWAESLPVELPTAWLPHLDVRASPSQPVVIPKGKYAGDWLLGDVNSPGLIRVSLDKVGDVYNGSVFFFSKGTGLAAINRLAFGPDGALYIGTLSTIAGNWPGGSNTAMYRLEPKPVATTFEMKTVRSLADGLEIEFTQPFDKTTLIASAFSIKQWQYIRQAAYGAGRQPDQALTVTAVETSSDNLRVHLKIGGLVPDRVIYIKHTGIKSAQALSPWNDESYFTLNSISSRAWNSTVATRDIVSKVSRPAGSVSCNVDIRGSLSVTVAAVDEWNAELVTLQGQILATQNGKGYSKFQLTTGNRIGLHLLRVQFKEGAVIRRVMLF